MKKSILIATENKHASTAINIHGLQVTIAQPGEDVIEVIQRQSFDLIFIDQNTEESMIRKMKAIVPVLAEGTEIVDFNNYDGLENAIAAAFDQQKVARLHKIVVMDTMGQ
jgi:hypothetical protein